MTDTPDLVSLTTTKLKEIAEFQDRVEGAAELAALIEAKRLPARMPAAFVLPIGEDAEAPVEMTGVQRQRITEQVAVVILEKKQGDAAGEAGRAKTVPLRQAVRDKLNGAVLNDAYDPMFFVRSRIVGINFGAVFHQVDFATRSMHSAPNT